jgi:hypothetical protein
MQSGGTTHPWGVRVASASLAVVIVLGSALLWIGIPLAGLWVAGRVTPGPLRAMMLALLVIPATMVALGWVLGRASGRYEQLRGTGPRRPSPPAWRSGLGDERPSERRRKGERRLIDIAMTVSAITAVLVLVVWFFLFAEMRLTPMP